MNRKRLASLASLLTLALLAGNLAGCGKATPTVTVPSATTTPETASTTAAATTGNPNISAPGQLPVVKNKETIRVVLCQSANIISYNYGENRLTTWLEDRTNVHVEPVLFAAAEDLVKLKIDLSSASDLGDLLLIPMSRANLAEYGAQGKLAPLGDLMKTHGYNLKNLMDKNPGAYPAITAPDGNIYGLPFSGPSSLSPDAYAERLWIHSGFLAKYGKGMPRTTEELYSFLKWVKATDVNGNGLNDEVGWTGSEKRTVTYARPTDFLMNAFTLQDQDGYYRKDDVIHCAMVEDGYRNGLRFLARLMAEGLMDENYIGNDEKTLKSLVALEGGNTVAAISAAGMGLAAPTDEIKLKYEPVSPLTGPDGFVNAFYDQTSLSVTTGRASISAKSERKDIAMAWMDANCSEEVALRARFGELGVDWEIPAAGTLAIDGGPARFRVLRDQWGVPTYAHWFTSSPAMIGYDPLTSLPKPAGTYDPDAIAYKAARASEKQVIPCSLPLFYFDQATSDKTAAWKAAINDRCRSAICEFIAGARNINDDAAWAGYVAEARQAGLDDYLKTMQTEYDRVWKGALPKTYTSVPQRTK
ncbi:MAG TPA: hypothetical protein VIL27_07895 [Clostridia bacterium]